MTCQECGFSPCICTYDSLLEDEEASAYLSIATYRSFSPKSQKEPEESKKPNESD